MDKTLASGTAIYVAVAAYVLIKGKTLNKKHQHPSSTNSRNCARMQIGKQANKQTVGYSYFPSVMICLNLAASEDNQNRASDRPTDRPVLETTLEIRCTQSRAHKTRSTTNAK